MSPETFWMILIFKVFDIHEYIFSNKFTISHDKINHQKFQHSNHNYDLHLNNL